MLIRNYKMFNKASEFMNCYTDMQALRIDMSKCHWEDAWKCDDHKIMPIRFQTFESLTAETHSASFPWDDDDED